MYSLEKAESLREGRWGSGKLREVYRQNIDKNGRQKIEGKKMKKKKEIMEERKKEILRKTSRER